MFIFIGFIDFIDNFIFMILLSIISAFLGGQILPLVINDTLIIFHSQYKFVVHLQD